VPRRPRLVATDLDGTLLRSDGTVSDRTRAVLAAARAAGLPVVAATARPARVARTLAADLGLFDEIVCLGGAQRYDVALGRLVSDERLADAVAVAVLDAIRELHPDAHVVAEVGLDIHVEEHFSLGAWGFAEIAEHTVRRSLAVVGPGVSALLVGHEQRELEELERLAWAGGGQQVEVTRSGGPHIEVFAAGVSKATGLAALCGGLGIAAADVVAIGDERNDVAMLAWAGRSWAVANARPEARAAAAGVCPANDEDGVAAVIEALLA
jgi:Cof subfamily protein (haloacid dehalogenase superfamily)